MAESPYPQMRSWPLSGLTFPWADYTSRAGSTGTANFAASGVGLGMVIMINWEDLESGEALKQLLGFSWRDNSGSYPVLRRSLPWQHPLYPQLWCNAVTNIHGLQQRGVTNIIVPFPQVTLGAPVTKYNKILLTLQFHRPPYPVLSDANTPYIQKVAPPLGDGRKAEWLRFTDRLWTTNVQIITREGDVFRFTEGSASPQRFQGTVGQRLAHLKLKRRWYQLPEAAVYNSDGFPSNLNVDTSGNYGLSQIAVTGGGGGYAVGDVITLAGGTPVVGQNAQVTVTRVIAGAVISVQISNQGAYTVTAAALTQSSVSPAGGAGATFSALWTAAGMLPGSVNLYTFFGCPPGTLFFEGATIIPQPLQLPPALMGLAGETYPLQYDVEMNFDYFNPPIGTGATSRGHNCMPYTADSLWYKVGSLLTNAPPFPYSDFNKLFYIL